MYTIVMDKYKNLNTTVRATLYKKENMVDKIQFLIPPKYDGNDGRIVVDEETGEETVIKDGEINMGDFTAVLKYVDPNGNFHSEILVQDADMYKNYLRYTLPVTTKLSAVSGNVMVRISFMYFENDGYISKFETNSTTVHIDKPQGFDDYVNFEDIEGWKREMEKMNGEIKEIQDTMPDDLIIAEEDDKLHLSHEGAAMGNGVDVMVPGAPDEDMNRNGVIEVDDVPEPDAEAYMDGDIQFYEAE